DFADSFVGSGQPLFVPMVINVPTWVDLSYARFKVEYSASDPQQVAFNNGSFTLPTQGQLRLWQFPEYVPRDARAVDSGGDYVAPGVYSWATLGGGTSRTLQLWVEAVRPTTAPTSGRIIVRLDPEGVPLPGGNGDPGWISFDAIRVTASTLDVDV